MEQEFPSFLMESYVQEKLLICTWKHTGFAFCFSTNTVLVYIRKNFREQMGNSKGLLQELWGLNQPKWFLLSQMLHSVDFCPDLLTFIPFTGDPDYPNPALWGSSWHSSAPLQGLEELCCAWCPSLAHPGLSLPGKEMGFGGMAKACCWTLTLGSLVLNLPRFNDCGMKRFHKKLSVTELVWVKTRFDKL